MARIMLAVEASVLNKLAAVSIRKRKCYQVRVAGVLLPADGKMPNVSSSTAAAPKRAIFGPGLQMDLNFLTSRIKAILAVTKMQMPSGKSVVVDSDIRSDCAITIVLNPSQFVQDS
jgi:hypothetical protein